MSLDSLAVSMAYTRLCRMTMQRAEVIPKLFERFDALVLEVLIMER